MASTKTSLTTNLQGSSKAQPLAHLPPRKEKQSKLSKLEDYVLTGENLEAEGGYVGCLFKKHSSFLPHEAKTEELVKLADSVLGLCGLTTKVPASKILSKYAFYILFVKE